MQEYLNSYFENWKDVVWSNLKFKKPNLVNANLNCIMHGEPFYVYPCFMKSGKQYFNVQERPQGEPPINYVQSCISKFRTEEIPMYRKTFKTSIIERTFNKDKSVFAKWIKDNQQIVNNCLEHDFKHWKTQRFIKDPNDYE
jgi:hypothetical protein